MSSKNQNIFEEGMGAARSLILTTGADRQIMERELERTQKADLQVATSVHKAKVSMAAAADKAKYAEDIVHDLQTHTAMSYNQSLETLQAFRPVNGRLGEHEQELSNDFIDYLEKRGGQHYLGFYEIAVRNIAQGAARHSLPKRRSILGAVRDRILGG